MVCSTLIISHTQQTNGNLSSGEEQDADNGRMPLSGHVLSPCVASVKRANSLSKKSNGERCILVWGSLLTCAVSY